METHRLRSDVHQAIVEFIDAGRRFAVATVIEAAGSTPRQAGTKALLDETGALWGTIGGGLLEGQTRRLAAEAIRSGQPVLFNFKFTGADAAESFPVCGGSLRVLVDPGAAQYREAYAAAAAARRERSPGVLVTSVLQDDPPSVHVTWQPGKPAPEATRPLLAESETTVLREEIVPEPLLVIVGGGHVAQALAEHAALVGFALLVIEDRAEFARPEQFPASAAIRCGDPAAVLESLPIDSQTYIAIVSRGHLTDSRALAACIRRPAAYIGMMGSRRKVALVRKDFLRSGRATEPEFDRIHAPIGLDIRAETVPEVAASIVAELIAARRKPRPPSEAP